MTRSVLGLALIVAAHGSAAAFPSEIERATQLIVSATESVPASCPASIWTFVKSSDVLCGHTEQSEEVFASHTAMTHPMFLNTQPWERGAFGIARGLIARASDGLYRLRVQRLSAPPKDAPDVNFLLEVSKLGDATGAVVSEEPAAAPGAPADCSRWSLRELKVGMQLGDAEKAHPNLRRVVSDEEGKKIAPVAFTWAEEGRPLGNQMLADGDRPEARVVAITVASQTQDVSWEEIQGALADRWGRASESHTLPTQGGILVDQVWRDPECDVKAWVVGSLGPEGGVLMLGLDSISAEEERVKKRRAERESKARSLLD